MKRLGIIVAAISMSSCISLPDVYLIDRQTVMEAEASGEWPQLEERFTHTTPKTGPTDLATEPSSKRRDRAFRVLNGEFPTNPSQAQSSTP